MKKRALLIINPHAGRMKLLRDLPEVDAILYNGGYEADVYFTKSRGDATEKVIKSASGYDLVVCGGGDGTYNEVISGILKAELDIPVGYIPAGTTNDFASTLELSPVHKTAAQKIVLGSPKRLDIGQLEDRYFSYIASFGAFTSSSYNANQKMKNTLGHVAYILEGIKDLSSLKSYRVRVETDDEIYEDDFIFGAICNSRSIAGLIKLDERIVDLSDGRFEVILIRMPRQIIELPKMLTALQSGDNGDKNVIFVHSNHIKITTPGKLDWSLDGEFASTSGEVELKNIKQAISLML
jgi:YegS/Rv2252/BmrU family lipid kinase